MDTNPNLRDKQ